MAIYNLILFLVLITLPGCTTYVRDPDSNMIAIDCSNLSPEMRLAPGLYGCKRG